nr:EAL domain-containing protein [Deinococcus puniceus]
MATLERIAHTDILTDLQNRRYLEHYLQDFLEHPQSNILALLFIDIDSFKLVNDTLGHTKGDDLLKQVAQLLLKLSGPQAVVTRLNGDEFVVVLPEMTGEDAELLGQQILDHLQTDGLELGAEFNHFRLTLSIGISVYPEDGLTSEELLRHADSAMFAVKRNGKQNVRRYNTADDADTEYRQELARELAGALERQEISLVFQPLYNLKTGELVKAEVLMRWHHPVFGWVSPAAFIPVAEQSGLINALGLWALQQSCGYARLWPDVTLCVNVSVLQLLQSNFAQQITELLNEYDLPARRLELELTETTLMQDNSSTVEALHALKKTGVGLTIDDFGIGYSNLARLRTLPVRTLKMDQSFTRHLAGSELDQRYAQGMINAVVQVSAIAGLHVTAEGIETFEQLQTVRALGCHSGQGYFLARPCNAQQFEAMLRNPIPTWATA